MHPGLPWMLSWLLVGQEGSMAQLCAITFRRQNVKSKIWSKITLAFLVACIWKFFMSCHSICGISIGACAPHMILVGQRELRGPLGSSFPRAMTTTCSGSHSMPCGTSNGGSSQRCCDSRNTSHSWLSLRLSFGQDNRERLWGQKTIGGTLRGQA